MAEKYDPKSSSRPLGDRKPPLSSRPIQPPIPSLDDDPLFELARIVSGKPSNQQAADARPERNSSGINSLPSGSDLARDLESELLNELQASFSIVPETMAASRAPLPAAQPIVSISPPSRAEAPLRPVLPERSETLRPVLPERTEPLRPVLPERSERVSTPKAEMRSERPQRADRVVTPPIAPAQDRATPFRPPQAPTPELGGMQFRPSIVPGPPVQAPAPPKPVEAPPVAASSRWDRPEKPPLPRLGAGRAAPARPEPPPEEPEAGVDFEDWDFLLEETTAEEPAAEFDHGAPVDEFDTVPGYAEDEQLPPFPEEELASLKSQRPSRTVLVIVGVLAVLLVAIGSLMLFRPGGSQSTPPQIIAADPTPTKVQPATDAPQEDDGQAKLIYDRVNPGADAANSQLAAQNDQPVADVPAATAEDSNNPISRVILPGGPGVDAPADGSSPQGAETGSTGSDENGIEPIGPKKVRTVVVRPDGTIVSSAAAPADGSAGAPDASAQPDQVGSAATANPAMPAHTARPVASGGDSDIAALEQESAAGGTVGARDAKGNVLPLPNANTPIASNNGAASAQPQSPAPEAVATAEPAPAPEPPPQARPVRKPAVASTDSGSSPIDLTPGQASGGQTRQAAVAGSGGYLVQVSSQRSEEAANSTFRSLQNRFPNVLGSYQPDIQRADLGAKGVYFRVRVGPFAQAEAQQVCDSLKSAGGDCILAPR